MILSRVTTKNKLPDKSEPPKSPPKREKEAPSDDTNLCSCCVWHRKEAKRQGKEYEHELHEIVVLPFVTPNKGEPFYACPRCDGDLLKLAQANNES